MRGISEKNLKKIRTTGNKRKTGWIITAISTVALSALAFFGWHLGEKIMGFFGW